MCRTHCHTLLEVILAANKMRDLWRDVGCNGTPVGVDPSAHPVKRAFFSKVAGDGNGEAFERLLPDCGMAGLVTVSLLHR